MSDETAAPEVAAVDESHEHPVAAHNKTRFLTAVAERGLDLEKLTLHEVSEVVRLAKVAGVSVEARIKV